MTYKSTAIIRKEGKWFVVRSLELGVTSQGRTIDEAKKNLREAVELYLEDMPRRLRKRADRGSITTIVPIYQLSG